MVRDGLARCAARGVEFLLALGDPAYYARFGFSPAAATGLECVYAGPAFQALELRKGVLAGECWRVAYPAAFAGLG